MKVLLDTSVLGLAAICPLTRTGVYRVVEQYLRQLATTPGIELVCCAPESVEVFHKTLTFRRQDVLLRGQPFVQPKRLRLSHGLRSMKKSVERFRLRPGMKWRLDRRLSDWIKRLEATSYPLWTSDLTGIEIYHSPYHPFPEVTRLAAKTGGLRRFLTVYDLIAIRHPEWFEFNGSERVAGMLAGLTENDWVFTISETTKADLCAYRPRLDPKRIIVTHLAASDLFYPCHDRAKGDLVRQRYGIPPGPYVLSVCTLEPRKNLPHVIRAFSNLIQQERSTPVNLVLVGAAGWGLSLINQAVQEATALHGRIVVTGYVDDGDLASLYSQALGFVYMSLYEGFGLPPLEAMQCGIPTITSNTSSLPEVVGDAGVLLDPMDLDGLCQALLDLCEKPTSREALSRKGIERARQFSWERFRDQTIEGYRLALRN